MTVPKQLIIPELLPVLAEIRREMLDNAPAAEEMIQAFLQECYVYLLRHILLQTSPEDLQTVLRPTPSSKLAAERIKKIERFFSQNYAAQVTLKDLADALYISTTQTNRILSEKYGQSFREKLRDTRLHQARLLLESTDRPASAIAAEVGYASATGFFAVFHKAFGVTPAEYRRKSNVSDTDETSGS